MNTDGLKLPTSGIAQGRFVEGMREIWIYNMNCDEIRGRWTTMIDGYQFDMDAPPLVCGQHSNDGHPKFDDWITEWRAKAKHAFEAEEQRIARDRIRRATLEVVRNGQRY
jgi:hypothetical protein